MRVFANGLRDRVSIPGRVILKTQKILLDVSWLNTQHYAVRIKCKRSNPEKRVAPYHTPWLSSYRKGSLRVALDDGRPTYTHTHIYIYINRERERFILIYSDKLFQWLIHYHHHVVPLARIPLTLSRHYSLSFIASGRSSGVHPVSSHSCWMNVRACRPYVGVHRSTSLMSSSLLLQQW